MMDALLPTAFMLLLTTGWCSGAVLPESIDGTEGGYVIFSPEIPSTEEKIHMLVWNFAPASGLVVEIFNISTEPEYENRVTVNESTGSLELRNLTQNDTGTYSVFLTLKGGTEYSGEAILNIYVAIIGVIFEGPTEELIAGSNSANLSCQAAAGTNISREWLKDGQPLSPSDRITFAGDYSIVSINPVQGTDNGQYQCRLTNPVSTVTASYSLTVNFGPENIEIHGEEKAEVNSTVELICSAESLPPANFSWLVNGTEKGTNSSFIIENITISHTGYYTCVASNDVTQQNSSDTHHLTVTIPAPPPNPEPGTSQPLSGGAIAGIVIGTIGGAGLIGGGGYFAYKKWYL